MNKIHKSKFNVSTGSWVACSELSSNKSKCKNRLGRLVLATMLGLGSSNLFAAECASLNGYGGGTCEIYENTGYSTSVGWNSILGASGGAQKTVVKSPTDGSLGDFIANSNTSSKYPDYTSGGFGANNGTLVANKLSVTLRPESGKVVRVIGAQVLNGGQLTAKDLDVDVVFARESTTVRGPIESYAVQVGTAITGEDRAATKTSKVTVENANLNITNTPNTQNNYIFWGFPTSLGAYQLSGIRIIRNEDNGGSNAIFESTGKVRINAYDSSNDNSGNYITGIYVSGDNNQAILNDSEIVIGKSGQYSSALKIGKGRATGTGGGEVVSKGQMILDTTAESTAPTIRLVGTGSKLTADSETSSAVIKSANNAILFGTLDYTTDYKSTDQQVALNNAKITTTSADASLVKTNAGVTGAKMTLKGSQSEATAAENGWLVEVEDPDKWSSNQAALIFNLDNQAVAKGLMTVSGASTLEATVSNGAQWLLKNKGDLTEQRSTLSSFNLTNGGVLDAGTYKAEEYFVNVPEFNNNGGIISLINDSYQDKLTIEGNYLGSNGAVVKMNTLWNAPGSEDGADSTSDILSITGTASGNTTVVPIKADGTENIIDGNVQQVASVLNTIPVVLVGTSGETAFTGTAQTTGATGVQLAKRTGSSGDEYYWTMSAKQPDTPTNPTNPDQPSTPIYANSVPGYVAMPRVNLEQGYSSIGTLHERRGENQTLAWDECGTCGSDAKGQTWARVYGKHLEQDGKHRLNLDTDIYGFQIGHDFLVKRNDNGSHNLTGGYVAYSKADTDFADEYRAENGLISTDKYTGKGKSDAISLGLTNTYYAANGSYLDVVGQVSYLRNKYESRSGSNPDSQNGWGAAVSAEVGRPFALGNAAPSEGGWLIEPQAQLIYQYVKLDDFNDGVRHVDQNGQDGLRGRLGVRLAYNGPGKDLQTNTFYAVANVWHDFMKPDAVTIGQDSLREQYASTWGEVGLGVQVPVAKHSYVYGDARYEHDLGSTKREGYRGSIGFKHTWK